MITKQALTKSEAIALGKGEAVYPEKISPLRFHVDCDASGNWLCYQNEEGDKTNDLTKTKFVPIFSADWNGISDTLEITLGQIPKGGCALHGVASSMTTLREQLKLDEGVRAKTYRDSVGKLTGGVGRNLDDVPFSPDEIELMLSNDITRALITCSKLFPDFAAFSQARQDALANMAFNLGETRLRGFAKMIEAINHGNWAQAAVQAKNSRWYTQVKSRAVRIVSALEAG